MKTLRSPLVEAKSTWVLGCWALGLLALACVEVNRDGLYADTVSRADGLFEAGAGGSELPRMTGGTAGVPGSGGGEPVGAADASSGATASSRQDAGVGDAGDESLASADATAGSLGLDAGRRLDAAPSAAAECSGMQVAGLCVYLAAAGDSCNAACADHGGFDVRLSSLVGSLAQGGSLSACQQLLEALAPGLPPASSGTRDDDLGLGCHLFGANSDGWWLENPDFVPSDSVPDARIVCACAR